ncbi:hypothetical protein BgiMline_005141, partial [Biomphalaria glabrata]
YCSANSEFRNFHLRCSPSWSQDSRSWQHFNPRWTEYKGKKPGRLHHGKRFASMDYSETTQASFSK